MLTEPAYDEFLDIAHARQQDLVERVKKYDTSLKEEVLNKAFLFAISRHRNQYRASGEPYYSHPIEVASILIEYRLDWVSIVTALLHDTVEDGVATYKEIYKIFGREIARLVDGVTKLSKLERPTKEVREAENFRKLLLAVSKDIRVLLVKLADRLHNMRTIKHLSSERKRRRIATETIEIYAPLAARVGMQRFREELEDLAFTTLNSDARDSIKARIKFLKDQDKRSVKRIVADIKRIAILSNILVEVSGREKQPYSAWVKMHRKKVAFEQISDGFAFRVITDSEGSCYKILGLVHLKWPLIPGKFKDYISTPKPNGYSSLHTTVIGPNGHPLEIQIKTKEMHEIAEYGVAAHWRYKTSNKAFSKNDKVGSRWLEDVVDIIKNVSGPEELIENTKLSKYQDQVFCFTPKGKIISLPQGATAIDFAYSVHSRVGHTAVGSKINGNLSPLQAELNNGDQVEILRSNGQTPQPIWLNFTLTGKARSQIRRFLRENENWEFQKLGRAILENLFVDFNRVFNDKIIDSSLKTLGHDSRRSLYIAIGRGEISARNVMDIMFPGEKEEAYLKRDKRVRMKKTGVAIRGLTPGLAYQIAECCHPLPGEHIVGIITEGKGVTVHAIDCSTLERFTADPERWLDITWANSEECPVQIGRLRIIIANKMGSLNTLTEAITRSAGNIVNLKITNRSQDFFELFIDIEVSDIRHLKDIVTSLRAESAFYEVDHKRS